MLLGEVEFDVTSQIFRCEKAAPRSGCFVPNESQLNDTAREEWFRHGHSSPK
jgi:hypothetical protein